MYRTDRQPAYQRDVTWASAVLLALTVLVGIVLFSLTQLSSNQRGLEVINGVLKLTLRPGGEGSVVGVRTGAEYQAGASLMLLPGLEVYADPSEIPTFSGGDAVSRSAGVLSERLISGGEENLLAAVSEPTLRRQLELALDGPALELIRGELAREMAGSGLDDGTRLADWPSQALAKPGQPVQPVVGVFVNLPVAILQRLDNRQIGAELVAALADTVADEGLPAALAVVTNDNLRARLTRGVDTLARAQLHQLFTALLSAQQPEMEARLAEAKAVLAGTADDSSDELSGLLPASELAGLSPQQADQRVLEALAEHAYRSGGVSAAVQLTRPEQVARVRGVAPLVNAFGAAAHSRYLTLTWFAGVIALLLLVLVVAFSRGWSRLTNVGIALAVGAAPGALLLDRLRGALPEAAPLSAGAQAQGVFAALRDLVTHAFSALPSALTALPLRNQLAVLLLGAGLVVLALVLWLLGGLRPRRRGFR